MVPSMVKSPEPGKLFTTFGLSANDQNALLEKEDEDRARTVSAG
jgi:hypothetical protein